MVSTERLGYNIYGCVVVHIDFDCFQATTLINTCYTIFMFRRQGDEEIVQYTLVTPMQFGHYK